MGFLLPLGFLFALSIPVLLLFYLLKVRRRPRRVSSTWLWRETVEDARASVPFQRLRRNLLMLLQILILALLTLALARPILNLRLGEAGSVLILIDTSASMAMRAEPGGKTRLDEAKAKATDLVNSLPRGVQALVLPYGSRAMVAAPFTRDRGRLRDAIAGLRVQATGGDLRGALVLAASLVGSEPSPQIVVFSDSAQLGPAETESLAGTPIVVEPCGAPAPNFGWTAMNVQRRSPTAEAYDLFGQILLHGAEPEEVTLRVEADGRLLDLRKVQLDPGVETPVVVEGLGFEGEPMVLARLSPAEGRHDALALDNDAWVRVRPSRRIRVLVCTPGNYFLSRALTAMAEVEPVFIVPGQAPPETPFDMAIYDRAAPARRPPVPALYIGLPPWPEAEVPATQPGPITHWDSEHPVSRRVQWSTVTVFSAVPVTAPTGTRALVESGESPLLTLGRAEGQVVLHLAFDVFDSNLPLRAAFPIFVRNCVDWLTQDRGARETQSWLGGETFALAVPEAVREVKLISPSNRLWNLAPGPDGRVAFAETFETGIWRVEIPGQPEERFGVNLMHPSESDPAVVEPLRIDARGERLAAGLGDELKANREVWRWVAAAALALLLLEWAFYRRPGRA
jgi:Ca-activated chloride channel homolog